MYKVISAVFPLMVATLSFPSSAESVGWSSYRKADCYYANGPRPDLCPMTAYEEPYRYYEQFDGVYTLPGPWEWHDNGMAGALDSLKTRENCAFDISVGIGNGYGQLSAPPAGWVRRTTSGAPVVGETYYRRTTGNCYVALMGFGTNDFVFGGLTAKTPWGYFASRPQESMNFCAFVNGVQVGCTANSHGNTWNPNASCSTSGIPGIIDFGIMAPNSESRLTSAISFACVGGDAVANLSLVGSTLDLDGLTVDVAWCVGGQSENCSASGTVPVNRGSSNTAMLRSVARTLPGAVGGERTGSVVAVIGYE